MVCCVGGSPDSPRIFAPNNRLVIVVDGGNGLGFGCIGVGRTLIILINCILDGLVRIFLAVGTGLVWLADLDLIYLYPKVPDVATMKEVEASDYQFYVKQIQRKNARAR